MILQEQTRTSLTGDKNDGLTAQVALDSVEAPTPQNRWDTVPTMGWKCPYSAYWMLNETTGEVQDFDCKSWYCGVHAPLQSWRWYKRTEMIPWTTMYTLTLVPEDKKKAAQAWTSMVRWLKKETGMTVYLRVMELGKRGGMRHWHILTDGRPAQNALLSAQASRLGLGRVTWVSFVRNTKGATWYLLGYVTKSLGVYDRRNSGWRRVTCSRKVASWKQVQEVREVLAIRRIHGAGRPDEDGNSDEEVPEGRGSSEEGKSGWGLQRVPLLKG